MSRGRSGGGEETEATESPGAGGRPGATGSKGRRGGRTKTAGQTASPCPRCGASARGNFCDKCGTSLRSEPCPRCGASSPVGARFCTRCGETLTARAGGTTGSGFTANLGWWAAGFLLVVLIAVVAWPVLIREPQPVAQPFPGEIAPGQAGGVAGGSGVDLSQLTPRQAADRLFDRVMRASEAGDQAQVGQFLPMTLQAYEMVEPLDADGQFHVALLHQTGGDFQAALQTAREVLEQDPDHLLLLYAAAQATQAMGDDEATAAYNQHILDVYDAERARARQEYLDHSPIVDKLADEARAYLAGS